MTQFQQRYAHLRWMLIWISYWLNSSLLHREENPYRRMKKVGRNCLPPWSSRHTRKFCLVINTSCSYSKTACLTPLLSHSVSDLQNSETCQRYNCKYWETWLSSLRITRQKLICSKLCTDTLTQELSRGEWLNTWHSRYDTIRSEQARLPQSCVTYPGVLDSDREAGLRLNRCHTSKKPGK